MQSTLRPAAINAPGDTDKHSDQPMLNIRNERHHPGTTITVSGTQNKQRHSLQRNPHPIGTTQIIQVDMTKVRRTTSSPIGGGIAYFCRRCPKNKRQHESNNGKQHLLVSVPRLRNFRRKSPQQRLKNTICKQTKHETYRPVEHSARAKKRQAPIQINSDTSAPDWG